MLNTHQSDSEYKTNSRLAESPHAQEIAVRYGSTAQKKNTPHRTQPAPSKSAPMKKKRFV
jgi:hypothetical protein